MNLTPNPSPAPASQNIPFPPTYPAAPKKRSTWFYIGLAGLIIGGLCCLLAVAALLVSFVLNRKSAPAATAQPVETPAETALPAMSTSLPAAPTRLPVSTSTPTLQAPGGHTLEFTDDFSTTNGRWYTGSTDEYEAAYVQDSYSMAVKNPNYYFVSLLPDPFPAPVGNIILNVRAGLAPGELGEVGVVCRYQDIDNYYLAAIAGDQFYIGKQVNGEWTYLTSPDLQPLLDSTPDQDGYLSMGFSCIDSFLVLEVNGLGAAHVTDDTFSTGDVGLYVYGKDQLDQSGFYALSYFDDFSAKLPGQ
jgi:hypothetical protein